MEKKQKFLIIGLSTLAILLLSAIVFITFRYYKDFTLFNNAEDNSFDRYVSEDSDTENSELAEEIVNEEIEAEEDENINEEKQGTIEEDENRQVLNINKDLTEEEEEDLEEEYGIEIVEKDENGVYVIETDEDSDLEGLEEDDDVDHIETDTPVQMFADTVDWGVHRIGADSIWDSSTGSGVTVAIIDTGIQTNHPDLTSNIVQGYDFVNDDTNAYDDNGHGTHVAGIVAATQNSAGTVGASHGSRLMPIKVLNASGSGYLSDVAQGIYYATDNGARVINLSLGASSDSYTLKTAVQYAVNRGVLIVAAAGNDYGAPCSYPAAYSNVVCVVATDSNNKLASFSNVGGELAAPGVSNYSTFLGSGYRYLSGTSMATPHVAGAAATIMSACTDCTTTEVRNTLRSTAIDLGTEGQDIIFGYGLVDLVSAIESVLPEEEEAIEDPAEETPTEEPTEEIPEDIIEEPEEKITYPKQTIEITEPETSNNNRYVHLNEDENVVVKFALSPISDNSGLEKTVVTLNNKEIYSTTKQEDEYEIELEDLDHSQHWLRVTSTFKDGKKSRDYIVIDMTYLGTSTFNRGRNVRGASTSIFDFVKDRVFNF